MIFRGTTVTHYFAVPFEYEDIQKVYVTYSQNNRPVIEKTHDDISYEAMYHNLVVPLSQADTLSFSDSGEMDSKVISIQIRVKLNDGRSLISCNEMKERLGNTCKGGAI